MGVALLKVPFLLCVLIWAAWCYRQAMSLGFRQIPFVRRARKVNTCLSVKNSGWPRVRFLSMFTVVAEIRAHAPKTQYLVAIIMISLVHHRKPLETKLSLFLTLSLESNQCSLETYWCPRSHPGHGAKGLNSNLSSAIKWLYNLDQGTWISRIRSLQVNGTSRTLYWVKQYLPQINVHQIAECDLWKKSLWN